MDSPCLAASRLLLVQLNSRHVIQLTSSVRQNPTYFRSGLSPAAVQLSAGLQHDVSTTDMYRRMQLHTQPRGESFSLKQQAAKGKKV